MQNFEAASQEQNAAIETEMERIGGQYTARMQSNLDEVARAQNSFRIWQKRKRPEGRRIADAAACCVPEASSPGGLTVVLERASSAAAR